MTGGLHILTTTLFSFTPLTLFSSVYPFLDHQNFMLVINHALSLQGSKLQVMLHFVNYFSHWVFHYEES